jgi:hypothetical protein
MQFVTVINLFVLQASVEHLSKSWLSRKLNIRHLIFYQTKMSDKVDTLKFFVSHCEELISTFL